MSSKRQNPSLSSLKARHIIGVVIVFLVVLITVILAIMGAEILRIGWRAGGMSLLRAFLFEETIFDWYQTIASGVIVAAVASSLTATAIDRYQKLKSTANRKRRAARSLTRRMGRSEKGCNEPRQLPKPRVRSAESMAPQKAVGDAVPKARSSAAIGEVDDTV